MQSLPNYDRPGMDNGRNSPLMAEHETLEDDDHRHSLSNGECHQVSCEKGGTLSWPTGASRGWLLTLTATVLILLLVATLPTHLQQLTIRPSQALVQSECGQSAEEAHQNGCIYSFVPGAWIPLRCYDSKLEAEFLAQKEWRWWVDNTTQQELSLDSVRSYGAQNTIYVTIEYHDYHCAYTWIALHRAVVRHDLIDTHIGNFAHTQHCARLLKKARERKQTVSAFHPIFASCMDPIAFDPTSAQELGPAS
jgi:hypothetical protein